jgi:ubiquinone/menaquinone biosynthesis C-methylase UbiE
MFKAFYAAIYDRISSGSERAGLSEERRGLLAQAAGATIEIGAGTGANLSHFPSAVTRLCLVEPDPSMRKRLHRRAGGRHVEIVDASAEALPFPDRSFDTAVVTFALCSVTDLDTALAEIARVPRPGGRPGILGRGSAGGTRDRAVDAAQLAQGHVHQDLGRLAGRPSPARA